MAQYRGEVTQYSLRIGSSNQPNEYTNVITVRGSFGRAYLYFVPESGALGANRKRPGENVFDIFLRLSLWTPVVDILRNEKPLNFLYDDSSNVMGIGPEKEPVGEEEARQGLRGVEASAGTAH